MTLALEIDQLRKSFGAVEALAGASLRVREGTVHALLGENGAGKTTLMRIAYGMLRPDAGTLRIFGEAAPFRSSADALARGVGMVHQHFTLVPAMTVAENVALGMRGRFDASTAADRVRQLGMRTGLVLDPMARAESLPVGAQQRLEIVKALARDARLLILDEPTAVLAPGEADELMRWVRRFRDEGRTVVLITHKLREALSVADDVTVLRRGRTVLAGAASTLDEPALVRALIGDDVTRADATTGRASAVAGDSRRRLDGEPGRSNATPGAVIASLRDVSVSGARGGHSLHGASLDVRSGEIVGIAAVEGSGQHELLRLLAGRLRPSRGVVTLPDRVAFIPEDRHRDAMVLDMSLVENVALRSLGARRGRMPWIALRNAAADVVERFDVRGPGIDVPGRALSGGNQQKLILGRELGDQPDLVVAENPTRGLDIRATEAVLGQLRAAKEAGSAVVLYSSDLDEVLGIADRVLIVFAGRLAAVDPPTRETVGRAMLGAE